MPLTLKRKQIQYQPELDRVNIFGLKNGQKLLLEWYCDLIRWTLNQQRAMQLS